MSDGTLQKSRQGDEIPVSNFACFLLYLYPGWQKAEDLPERWLKPGFLGAKKWF